jgi:cytochrome P450
MAIDYDPTSHEVMQNPWPYYAQLRAEAPVFYHEGYDTWFLSRFEDVWEATGSDAFTVELGVMPESVFYKEHPPKDPPVFTMLDMPRQRPYRRVLSPSYGKNKIARLEGMVREKARGILAPLIERGELDVYRDYANPLATRVIANMIGIDEEETLELREGVERFFAREPHQKRSTEAQQQILASLIARLAEIAEERAAAKDWERDDHMSAWLSAEVEGRRMSPLEVGINAYNMLVTGAEVIPLSVANSAYYLWQHPDQRKSVVDDPSLVPHAFAESLRFDQPTNLLGRFVKHDVEIRGQMLREGQGCMLLWASANRDENEFEQADRFDITRRPRRSLSYGHGFHKCIGEHLGNLEGRILLEELLAAAPNYEIDAAGVGRAYSEFLHGYTRMPLRLP